MAASRGAGGWILAAGVVWMAAGGCRDSGPAGGAGDVGAASEPVGAARDAGAARGDGDGEPRDLRGAGPRIAPIWQVDLATDPAATAEPIAVHQGPYATEDGLAVESSAIGYVVVRPTDGRVLRRRVHQPLAARLLSQAAPRLDWPMQPGERYAAVAGALAIAGGGARPAGSDVVRAIATDGGVGPALVDRATGRRQWRGAVGPPASVMSAAWSADGFLAVAVRFSGGTLPVLKDDAVLGFAPDGSLAWAWPVPVPDRERGDPIGLWVTDDAVYAFFDGRFLAALPTVPNRGSGSLGKEASPGKVKRISPP